MQRRRLTVAGVGVVVLVVQFLFCSVVSVGVQSDVSFTSDDVFEVPSQNGSIRFVSNGTYTSANLNDGVWIFQNLYMSGSRGDERLNLTVSAMDCDLTFYPYMSAPYSYGVAVLRWVMLSYTVSGSGRQVINLGFDPDNSQLDVILDGNFAARNQGWTKSDDGTVTITGSYSNVTLWYIKHPEPSENDTFLTEHSVMIGSTSFLAVTLLLATVVKHRKKATGSQ